ncbi:hypothetical protein FB45DRAFT_1005334 [Roridomyces roridus]|uniref:Uncharacterized protein n=1 Tax=Roridomyces roridus TaxID=1738132 RepID=A0AAD7BPH3_9AGAR|nr:hypothetical protein FB45DRAFT_1005334 [Roridomyces roridus]
MDEVPTLSELRVLRNPLERIVHEFQNLSGSPTRHIRNADHADIQQKLGVRERKAGTECVPELDHSCQLDSKVNDNGPKSTSVLELQRPSPEKRGGGCVRRARIGQEERSRDPKLEKSEDRHSPKGHGKGHETSVPRNDGRGQVNQRYSLDGGWRPLPPPGLTMHNALARAYLHVMDLTPPNTPQCIRIAAQQQERENRTLDSPQRHRTPALPLRLPPPPSPFIQRAPIANNVGEYGYDTSSGVQSDTNTSEYEYDKIWI